MNTSLLIKGILIVTANVSAGNAGAGTWTDAAEEFSLGPVPAHVDLRNMLCEYIVHRS